MVQNDVFLKLILNILKSYENYAMIIHSLQINRNVKKSKREMLSDHILKIADLYNIRIGYAKKLVSNIFDKEKYMI